MEVLRLKVIENVNASTLTEFAINNVKLGSEMQTDEFRSYSQFNQHFKHKTVNHQREYVTADKVSTNGLEGFWALLKRGIQGNFHHISKHYLQKYVDEFCFRYNARYDENVFDDVLVRMLFV